MDYVWISVILAAFLVVFGVIFFQIAKQSVGSVAGFFLAFSLLYFGLAHFSMATAAGLGIEEAYTPACEYQLTVTDEIYKYGNNLSGYHWDYASDSPSCTNPNDPSCVWLFHKNTTYTYNNTCGDAAAAATTQLTIFLWLIYIDCFALFIGGSVAGARWFMKRW